MAFFNQGYPSVEPGFITAEGDLINGAQVTTGYPVIQGRRVVGNVTVIRTNNGRQKLVLGSGGFRAPRTTSEEE